MRACSVKTNCPLKGCSNKISRDCQAKHLTAADNEVVVLSRVPHTWISVTVHSKIRACSVLGDIFIL